MGQSEAGPPRLDDFNLWHPPIVTRRAVAHSWPKRLKNRAPRRQGSPAPARSPRPHRDHTGAAFGGIYGSDGRMVEPKRLGCEPLPVSGRKAPGVGCSPSGIDRLVKSFSPAATAHVAPMGSQSERESPLRQRIRLLRELERSLAEKPDAEAHILALAAVRELLTEAEAKLER